MGNKAISLPCSIILSARGLPPREREGNLLFGGIAQKAFPPRATQSVSLLMRAILSSRFLVARYRYQPTFIHGRLRANSTCAV